MAFNARTGQMVYNVDDLIGMARIGSFGQKSDLVFAALRQLKTLQVKNETLEKELLELRESVANIIKIQSSVSEISEINISDYTEEKDTKKKK
jgi:Arc/MetJ-type ribon-helix-helix transcriptional regulator